MLVGVDRLLQPMNLVAILAILGALVTGPLLFAPLERNLDLYCLALGIIAVTVAGCWGWTLLGHAFTAAVPISLVVIAADLLFGKFRSQFDDAFAAARRRLPRPALVASSLVVLALLSSIISALVAALMLAESVRLVGLARSERTKVVVLGCFAIGLGAALTPLGEPVAAIASSAMQLDFFGLSVLLGSWVLPAIAGLCAIATFYSRGTYDLVTATSLGQEAPAQAVGAGIRVLAFIVGLIFAGEAFAPVSSHYLEMLSNETLFWVNLSSAALDNATLVAIEFHGLDLARARAVLLSLLVSGGMLIPGNIPNLVCANKLGIPSSEWARIGVPVGLILLGIYFAALFVVT
jgi:predicted cation transporter